MNPTTSSPQTSTGLDGALARLLAIVVREVDAVANLAYRQHVCLLLLGAGSVSTLDTAVDDLVDAEDELAALELLRSAASADLAVRLGLDPSAHRLRDLTEVLGDEGIELARRADELRTLTADLHAGRALATELAAAQLEVIADRSAALADTVASTGYDQHGQAASGS